MDETHLLVRLAAALATGLLVGMQRGWALRDRRAGLRVAGFRTFGLLGFCGGLASLLPAVVGAAVAFAACAVIAIGYAKEAGRKDLSATSAVASIVTFAAGFAAVAISVQVGLAAGAATFAILSARQSMHALLRGMDEAEIDAGARFAIVALIILPLLPDTNIGPYDAWNPRNVWMMVVVVTGMSFLGYAAARRLGGQKGTMIVAFLGSMVSSTAVTADCARHLRTDQEGGASPRAGIAVASVVMFVRVEILVMILAPGAAPSMAFILAPAALTSAAFAFAAWQESGRQAHSPALANPLSLLTAFILAAWIAVLAVASHWALELFGRSGIAVVLALTGLVDVDAAVITMGSLPAPVLSDPAVGLMLVAPVAANTIMKAMMTVVIAGRNQGWRASLSLWSSALSLAAGVAALSIF
ncbi:MgtC/SapB family protein [Novosphingobium sp. BL-52-GroH]|uniref:MgtC/SapB family protein n=1 Tax=Novosphingobium sp. BL-52-GroH TaxID=3349877 RepID=UPI00384D3DD7